MTAAAEIDAELVRRLADLLEEMNLSEIEYATDGWRVRVARNTAPATAPAPAPVAAPAKAEAAEAEALPPGAVTSPMVGTVYLAPEPGAPNFVSEGDEIAEGQTLLLIEAMKTFNEIRAPRAGTVKRILVENATPVEYGDVLMIIE